MEGEEGKEMNRRGRGKREEKKLEEKGKRYKVSNLNPSEKKFY